MWGRLGMNTDRTCFKIIKEPSEWFKMIDDKQYKIIDADFSHKNMVQVFYKHKLPESSVETSVVHAAFVTCYARLKLYSELEKLGSRVLYFDTDSIIFICNGTDYSPTLGFYLGDLTNELDSGDYILSLCRLAQKITPI